MLKLDMLPDYLIFEMDWSFSKLIFCISYDLLYMHFMVSNILVTHAAGQRRLIAPTLLLGTLPSGKKICKAQLVYSLVVFVIAQ